jgi:hypothetical protein
MSSSSAASRPKPSRPAQRRRRRCFGPNSPQARSPCARPTAGGPWPRRQPISLSPSPLDWIASRRLKTRRPIPAPFATTPAQLPLRHRRQHRCAARANPPAVKSSGDFVALEGRKPERRNRIVERGGRARRESARRAPVSNRTLRDSSAISRGRQSQELLFTNRAGWRPRRSCFTASHGRGVGPSFPPPAIAPLEA